ncbi:sulfatase-like hydrolase/transferase, partial [Serratia marcescens]
LGRVSYSVSASRVRNSQREEETRYYLSLRETNPRLKQDNVVYFKNASSCGTETAISVPCMFSNMPRKEYDAT